MDELKLRELKQKDVYRLSKILKKLDLREGIKGLFTDATGKSKKQKEDLSKGISMEFALIFFENMHRAEDDVNFFLGDLVGLNAKEFGDLPIKQSFGVIKSLFGNEEILDFFRMASEQMK